MSDAAITWQVGDGKRSWATGWVNGGDGVRDVEISETSEGLVHRNVVSWGLEEVATRFSVRGQP